MEMALLRARSWLQGRVRRSPDEEEKARLR